MTQFNMNEYLAEEEKVKLNIIKEIDEKTNDSTEIKEIKNKNGIYKTWTVKLIRPLVIKFLKTKYPDSLIPRELNDIDLVILDNKTSDRIPVEIQRTPIGLKNRSFAHTEFENHIRKGIDQNIITYGKCWFFFDSEYLRYLQSGNVGNRTSINITWLVELMKENKLKVFTIQYDGIVKELTTKDFDFLKDVSQTCTIGYNNDERIINRNKLDIYRNVTRGYNFTQDEIDKFYYEFDNRDKEEKEAKRFFIKNGNERCNIYGNIIDSLGSLPTINNCLDMNMDNRTSKYFAIYLGIFEVVGNHLLGRTGNHMKFVDKFDICKYFPGYLRQEKHWLTYKGNEMDGKTFSNICSGMYKKASTIFDY